MTDLSVNFCGVEFPNPTVLASGVMGVTAASMRKVANAGAGGVTTKSIWLEEHIGHKNPTMIGTDDYFVNAVGLPDAGLDKALDEWGGYMQNAPVPLIANIVGGAEEDFYKIAEAVNQIKPHLIEVNLSCPNVGDEFGKPLACSRVKVEEMTKILKTKTDIPLIIKMSPNVTNWVEIAKAAEDAGADGLCCFNTFGPGMVIDIDSRMPILANKVGGVSGPGLRPLVVKMINDIYKAVKIPIIGTGGILTGRDAIEIMMAGATLVGIGTMVFYRDVDGFGEVVKEMNEWCDENGIEKISDIIGSVKI
jgi:dihydroorotate dehydrogenase (NAD+) catalytic subunit